MIQPLGKHKKTLRSFRSDGAVYDTGDFQIKD